MKKIEKNALPLSKDQAEMSQINLELAVNKQLNQQKIVTMLGIHPILSYNKVINALKESNQSPNERVINC